MPQTKVVCSLSHSVQWTQRARHSVCMCVCRERDRERERERQTQRNTQRDSHLDEHVKVDVVLHQVFVQINCAVVTWTELAVRRLELFTHLTFKLYTHHCHVITAVCTETFLRSSLKPGAKGVNVERVWIGERVSPSQLTRGSGQDHELPAGSRAEPQPQTPFRVSHNALGKKKM